MQYKGSCQCGALAFEAEIEGLEKALRCNCSRCRRIGSVFVFIPAANLRHIKGEKAATSYLFNKRHIDHRFCPVCGVEPYAFGAAPDGSQIAAVNLRCLDGVDVEAIRTPVYDGASL